ncbi:MAG: helix-hairpin-helix domain-containing protein [Ruminococcus sp.]|nr:helix-hairpin-helix domain-containing protein [Ruminococcus sp.]
MKEKLTRLFDKIAPDRESMHSLYIKVAALSLLLAVVLGNIIVDMKPKSKPIKLTADSSSLQQESETVTGRKTTVHKKTSTVKTTAAASRKATTTKPVTTTQKKTTTTKAPKVTQTQITYYYPADINTADLGCLCAADGIGEELAGRILAFRDSVGCICNMEQLLEIDGIGEGKLEKLCEQFYVSEDVYRPMDEDGADEPDEDEEPPEEPSDDEEPKQEPDDEEKVLRRVNINTASAEEIADCLLIDIEQAKSIIELRGKISYFSSPDELLLEDTMSADMIWERYEFIDVSR